MVLSVAANTLTVWLGPADGSAVDRSDDAQFAPFLVPTSISRSLGYGGGDRLDHASFDYNLAVTGQRVQNVSTPFAGYARQVEVHWEQGGGVYTPIFWGDLTAQSISVGRSETVNVTASVFPYHFGEQLEGPVVRAIGAPIEFTTEGPIEFNPLIDGVIEGNRSGWNSENNLDAYFWIDPESARTPEAREYQGEVEEPALWTLDKAILSICHFSNPSEALIKNPTSGDLSGITWPTLKHVTLPPYEYLPYYLDALLHPYGFDWGISLTVSGGVTTRKIRVIERGSGSQKTLKQQAVGSDLNLVSIPPYTDTESFNVTTDIAGSVNEVHVFGGYEQTQGTFELEKGWSESDDEIELSELEIANPGSGFHTDKSNVWRLWVLNEAGDYNGTRTEITSPPTFHSAYAFLKERRRSFEDCLTVAEDGFTRLPPVLEWSFDAGTTWEPAPPEWSYRILDKQCGVYFTGNYPPIELMLYGDESRVRVTAVLTGDYRMGRVATDEGNNSPNGRTNRLTIDMSDSFALRKLSEFTPENKLVGDADTRDDSESCLQYAKNILTLETSAMLDGSYNLIGVRFDYDLGDVLTAIEGRAISLNRNAAGGTLAKYPQITGIIWRPQRQQTDIITAAYENDFWVTRNQPRNTRGGREV